ncbi:MAG TPA: ATP-binding protein [Acidobacteriota bacterium]|nr:ATP-binding protein [Acidobacteriota bacterium]
MKQIRRESDPKRGLRTAAERALRRKRISQTAVRDMPHLIHELQVHQIELEMQNDELRKAQAAVEESRSRYARLYDFAPVGYITLDPHGLIVEANLTAASLLMVERKHLLKRHFYSFVAPEDREHFLEHRRLAGQSPEKQSCELRLVRKDSTRFHALMESVSVLSPLTNKIELQSSISDITELRKAGEALRESERGLKRLSSQLMNVQESERKRIAWEIHDGIGQSLGAVKYTLESVIRSMRGKSVPDWIDPLQTILPMLQTIFDEVRRIQADLRPPLLDDIGLEAAVSWSCRQLQETYRDIHVETRLFGELSIPEHLKTVIFRVVQEGLTNIAKHSRAHNASVTLRRKRDLIELTIKDDGEGFKLEDLSGMEETRRGIGISSMKERTELVGGEFEIESSAGKGTTLKASWPISLPPPPPADAP